MSKYIVSNFNRGNSIIAIASSLVFSSPVAAQCPTSGAATSPVTVSDESASIQAARQLSSGQNTVVDTTMPGQIKVSIPNSGVTAGSYTNANISVNAQGVVTSAASGSSGGGSASNAVTAGNLSAGVPNFAVPSNGLIQPLPIDHTLSIATPATEYSVPTGSSTPLGVCAGPDKNVWFTESNQNKIAKIGVTGSVTEYTVITSASVPSSICTGPDGNLWFTEQSGNNIGKISTGGTVTEYAIPTVNSQPTGICAGPDGNLWFVENNGNKVGKITTAGSITEYSIPTVGSQPRTICAGPDGKLWFVETAGNKVANITTAGTLTEYSIPTASSSPFNICVGTDGNLWFTESATNKIGKVTTSGTFTEYTVPTASSTPYGICAGADGNLWFCENATDKVASVTPGGAINEYALPSTSTGASYIAVGTDGNLWLTEQSANKVATWGFTVAGTTPILNSITGSGVASVTRSPSGITISISGASGVSSVNTETGTVVSPWSLGKRFAHFEPAGLTTGTTYSIGPPGWDGIDGYDDAGNGVPASGNLYRVAGQFALTAATTGSTRAWGITSQWTRAELGPKVLSIATAEINSGTFANSTFAIGFTPNKNDFVTSNSPTNSVGFRYNPGAGDSHWIAYSADGTTATTVDTGLTPDGHDMHTFVVDMSNYPTSIKYYFDQNLVATITTHLPVSTTNFYFSMMAKTNESVQKGWSFGSTTLQSN